VVLTRARFRQWLRGYERAWRSPGTAALAELFAAEASYRPSPYAVPLVGLEAIGAMWEREREGPDEPFEMRAEVVAVEGGTGVARVEVAYARGHSPDYRDLWIARFDGTGLCVAFEEWPFWPGQPLSAPR
jgi:hypothetical protein